MAKGKGGFLGQDGLNAPDQVTGVTASGGDGEVSVSWTDPENVGLGAITSYRVQSNTGASASGSSSPITVTGLTNGTSYTFNVWAINPSGWSAPSDAATGSPAAPIAVFNYIYTAEYVTIATTGNTSSWGTTQAVNYRHGAVSSKTRGIYAGGGGDGTHIEYAEIPTGGSFSDFGDLLINATYYPCGSGNSTRGLFAFGTSSETNVIQYITIASVGNATDFGDTPASRSYAASMGANSTRALWAGGYSGSQQSTIYYATIATTGNASTFGTLTQSRYSLTGASNATRGFCAGGYAGSFQNTIDYVTIATTGSATDFGDLTATTSSGCATAGSTRGLIASVGGTGGGGSNVINYITLASAGNASDFGDLWTSFTQGAAFSNGHGGLS